MDVVSGLLFLLLALSDLPPPPPSATKYIAGCDELPNLLEVPACPPSSPDPLLYPLPPLPTVIGIVPEPEKEDKGRFG